MADKKKELTNDELNEVAGGKMDLRVFEVKEQKILRQIKQQKGVAETKQIVDMAGKMPKKKAKYL